MKKLEVNMSKLSDKNMGLIIDILCDEFGDEFRDLTKSPHTINLTAERSNSEKDKQIAYIKEIVAEHGSFTTADVEADSSPCIASVGNGRNVSQLVESFYLGYAEVVTYVHDTETNTDSVPYEDFDADVIDDICRLAEDWEADCLQTEKRIS